MNPNQATTAITFWQIAPTLVSLVVLIVGYIYASGRLKEKVENMLTKEEFLKHCKSNQDDCAKGVGIKIDELKGLVVELHDKQTQKIESMDEKREKAKEDTSRAIAQSNASTAKELGVMNKAIGRIEGHVEILRNGHRRVVEVN